RDDEYIKARMEKDAQKSAVSIYELHLGSWRKNEGECVSYRNIAPALAAYCKEMGYTHVELLPICEYPFEGSWGYQVTGYFAPTSRYGTPQDFMYFVDMMHENGIGVIMDFVPAHFPKDAHGLARFDGTPLFESADRRMAEHPEWGTLIFDFDKPQVQSFLVSSAMLFFDKYHIDGIRTDAVSSMLYLDYGRKNGDFVRNKYGENINLAAVEFLRKLNSVILTNFKGCMTVAEESTAYPLVTYPPSVGGLGFTFKWDMGYMHDTLEYMSMDHLFRRNSHDKMTFSMMYAFSERFILAYSHDETVHGKKSMIDKMFGTYEEKFASLKALYGFTFAHPGKKLTFMGSEFGQFIEWDYKKELDWFLLKYPAHDSLREYCRALNFAYRKHPAAYLIDDSWDGFIWLSVNNRDQSVLAFLRRAPGEKGLACVCNFTPCAAEGVIIGLPQKGKLKLILNSDDPRYGGAGARVKKTAKARKTPFEGHPYSAKLDIPPLSALYYEYYAEEDTNE
ncbi:MAG: 1,4-alpha-glucan branching protein GlgB, partial [Clostridia bacterium]|nr:1,4-alpha-glucan branching protein GlgB [Clostridia bacterium]